MRVYFPGGKKVYADYRGFTIKTDQPQKFGGEGTDPSPFDLFLASLATCAGYYVLSFCLERNIDTAGLEIRQSLLIDENTKTIDTVQMLVEVPASFPAKYHNALVRAAQQCSVKKHLDQPPLIEITVSSREPQPISR